MRLNLGRHAAVRIEQQIRQLSHPIPGCNSFSSFPLVATRFSAGFFQRVFAYTKSLSLPQRLVRPDSRSCLLTRSCFQHVSNLPVIHSCTCASALPSAAVPERHQCVRMGRHALIPHQLLFHRRFVRRYVRVVPVSASGASR